jgi:hypothetical protein
MDDMNEHGNDNPAGARALAPGRVEQLCAGMPQTGERQLDFDEFDFLCDLSIAHLRKALTRGAAAIAALGAMIALLVYLLPNPGYGLWYDALLVFLVIATALVAVVAFMQPLDHFLRHRVMKRAADAACVRVFEGSLNPDDFTDRSRRWLENSGLIDETPGHVNTVELYASDNVVHTINGDEPDAWISVALTHAAAVPEDPMVLDVPVDWFPDEAGGLMQRRHQTQQEHQEILRYAQLGRQRLNQVPLIWGIPLFLATVFVMHALLEFGPAATTWVAAGIAAAVIVFHIVRMRRKIRALQEDADYGWVIRFTPPQEDAENGKAPASNPVITEFLPASETLWSFAERPAAWRYAGTPKASSRRK